MYVCTCTCTCTYVCVCVVCGFFCCLSLSYLVLHNGQCDKSLCSALLGCLEASISPCTPCPAAHVHVHVHVHVLPGQVTCTYIDIMMTCSCPMAYCPHLFLLSPSLFPRQDCTRNKCTYIHTFLFMIYMHSHVRSSLSSSD